MSSNQPPPDSETVKLPTFQVNESPDLPPPESWRYARVGNFEVLSNASDRATRNLLADFAMFTRAMSLVWPAPAIAPIMVERVIRRTIRTTSATSSTPRTALVNRQPRTMGLKEMIEHFVEPDNVGVLGVEVEEVRFVRSSVTSGLSHPGKARASPLRRR